MITRMTYLSHSPEDTQEFARKQALRLVEESSGQPIVIALEGELGAGKTTFTQAFATVLGVHENVKSPTFVLMKHYKLTNVINYHTLYHLDCYRLNNSADLLSLGTSDIIQRAGNIVLIEWAERVADILPKSHWVVHIDHVAEHDRNIKIELRSKN